MPTYQYVCTECDHAFEQVQGFSEDSLTVCPRCEGRLRKIFNAVGVVFKGSGFYRTDNRADAKVGATAGDATTNGSSHASSEGSSSSDSSSGAAASSDGSSAAKSTSAPTPAKTKAGAA